MRGGNTTDEELVAWLSAIDKLNRQLGCPPTSQELADEFGVKSRSVAWNRCAILKDHGLVDWRDGKQRTLQLTPKGRRFLRKGALIA